jgi:hypothetical protein
MKFFFPDSQDMISPAYDFINDEYPAWRVRQRDDQYAHEVLPVPYDGILVSKAIVDGSLKGAGKYSTPQRERLYRLGVRKFFRLPQHVTTLGDCGAFNYIDEHKPPYTVEEVLDFYEGCGFELGVSVDHVIFGYDKDAGPQEGEQAWRDRREISLEYAQDFFDAVQTRSSAVQPVGAAQGWSPTSYADSVEKLQGMGYRRIALGGMVPLKTNEILDCLQEIDKVRGSDTELHLLGITRVDSMSVFAEHGVTSFDSTSAFRQSFMDDRDNYHTLETTYAAIRVPQVDGNPALKRQILSGGIEQADAIARERACLGALREYNKGQVSPEEALDALEAYESLVNANSPKKKTYMPAYRRTLEDAPWRKCPCTLCEKHGIEMVIFRGTERNKRRGFHNLSVLAAKMHALPAA